MKFRCCIEDVTVPALHVPFAGYTGLFIFTLEGYDFISSFLFFELFQLFGLGVRSLRLQQLRSIIRTVSTVNSLMSTVSRISRLDSIPQEVA